jgi:ASC-1-like (ASCH) protein
MLLECSVGDPWFAAIRAGLKTVEGRLAGGKFAGVNAGDMMTIRHSTEQKASFRPLVVRVTRVSRYPSFRSYLENEGLRNALPGVDKISKGVAVYRQFYSAREERDRGVLALQLQVQ